RVPVDLPEGGEGRRELEVAAEALEARAMREVLDDEVQVLLGRAVSGLAQVEALSLPALPDVLGRGQEALARSGGEDADGNRLSLATLHHIPALHEAALPVRGRLQ